MERANETSLTDLMRIRAEAKRENLRVNGQTIKGEMLKLIDLIDAGAWETFDVRRGEITSSAAVRVHANAIAAELRRRENILHYAKIQLGGLER